MKKLFAILLLSGAILSGAALADSATVNSLLKTYAEQGSGAADAGRGRQMWQKTFNGKRSCAGCHTKDLTATGEHIKTGKKIKPMSPAVNPERLSDVRKVNKWFKRNCKWTLGRECTPQEKSDFLLFLQQPVRF